MSEFLYTCGLSCTRAQHRRKVEVVVADGHVHVKEQSSIWSIGEVGVRRIGCRRSALPAPGVQPSIVRHLLVLERVHTNSNGKDENHRQAQIEAGRLDREL